MKTKKGLLILLLPFLLGWAGFEGPGQIVTTALHWLSPDEAPPVRAGLLSPSARTHILYGDAKGGGHLHGVGTACKSEFPASWDADKVIQTIQLIAANDNLNWRRESNGYYVAEQKQDGINVRVVLDREKDDIVTAYPVGGPRNPCPANDNRRP